MLPTPFLAQEYDTIDGYRDNSQLKQGSTFDKISFPILGGILSLRYNYFQSDWGAAGYVPIDWVKSGHWDRTRAYDPTDGGYAWRYQVVMNYAPACGERGLYATLYFDKSYDISGTASFFLSQAVSSLVRMIGRTGAAAYTTTWSSATWLRSR